MGVQMLFGDIEAELADHLVTYLNAHASKIGISGEVLVTNQIATETAAGGLDMPAEWAVGVRDDGGQIESAVTRRHTIGTTILGSPKDIAGRTTAKLAELVMLAVAELPMLEDSNVAAVTAQMGPYRIVQGNNVRPARYATHELVASGRDPVEVLGG